MTCLQTWIASWGKGKGIFQTADIVNKKREQERQGTREYDKTAEIMGKLRPTTYKLST